MKIGQTSIIVFLSKLLGSALGFIATLYFARDLGAEVLGVYALVMTVVLWLILLADLGIGKAMMKRISENEEPGEYPMAAVVWISLLATLLSVGAIFAQPVLESYIGDFDQYVALSVVWFVVGLVVAKLAYRTTVRMLKGERKVHIAGLLDPVKIGGQSLLQVGLVVAINNHERGDNPGSTVITV